MKAIHGLINFLFVSFLLYVIYQEVHWSVAILLGWICITITFHIGVTLQMSEVIKQLKDRLL